HAGDGGLGGAHAAGDLGLREFGFRARADEFAGEREFGFEGVVLAFDGGVLQGIFLEGFEASHGSISFSRANARSISRGGVVCVFLMKVRRTTTRWPLAAA